jgi:hypothetical protein
MAQKIYKSAMGRVVDLGALMLENENTRAVGNMNVNARGDTLDNANRVVESKPKQVQKHYQRQSTNTSATPPTASTKAAKKQQSEKIKAKIKAAKSKEKVVSDSVLDAYNDERLVSKHDKMPEQPQSAPASVAVEEVPEVEALEEIPEIESLEELAELEAAVPELTQEPTLTPAKPIPRGGLAAAIAKAQTVKQELLKTPRQTAQSKPGVNKI